MELSWESPREIDFLKEIQNEMHDLLSVNLNNKLRR